MDHNDILESLFTTEVSAGNLYENATLPIYAGLCLQKLEELFGPRDPAFTLLGMDISRTTNIGPYVRFPDSGKTLVDGTDKHKYVIILLSPQALLSEVAARSQLAHECVHLLDPWNRQVEGRRTNYLEEGLAHWFQNRCVPGLGTQNFKYALAESLVLPLMDKLPSVISQVRQDLGVRIGEITFEMLQPHFPNVKEETLHQLCECWENYPLEHDQMR